MGRADCDIVDGGIGRRLQDLEEPADLKEAAASLQLGFYLAAREHPQPGPTGRRSQPSCGIPADRRKVFADMDNLDDVREGSSRSPERSAENWEPRSAPTANAARSARCAPAR